MCDDLEILHDINIEYKIKRRYCLTATLQGEMIIRNLPSYFYTRIQPILGKLC